MSVHLNSFSLSLAKSCCWTVTNYFNLEMLKHVDIEVNSNDKGKEMLGVESKKELPSRVNFPNHCCVLLEIPGGLVSLKISKRWIISSLITNIYHKHLSSQLTQYGNFLLVT